MGVPGGLARFDQRQRRGFATRQLRGGNVGGHPADIWPGRIVRHGVRQGHSGSVVVMGAAIQWMQWAGPVGACWKLASRIDGSVYYILYPKNLKAVFVLRLDAPRQGCGTARNPPSPACVRGWGRGQAHHTLATVPKHASRKRPTDVHSHQIRDEFVYRLVQAPSDLERSALTPLPQRGSGVTTLGRQAQRRSKPTSSSISGSGAARPVASSADASSTPSASARLPWCRSTMRSSIVPAVISR